MPSKDIFRQVPLTDILDYPQKKLPSIWKQPLSWFLLAGRLKMQNLKIANDLITSILGEAEAETRG